MVSGLVISAADLHMILHERRHFVCVLRNVRILDLGHNHPLAIHDESSMSTRNTEVPVVLAQEPTVKCLFTTVSRFPIILTLM